MQRQTTKIEHNNGRSKTQEIYELSKDTSPHTMLTIINIQHTSMRSLTQALRTHSQSKDLTYNGGLSQIELFKCDPT